MNRNAVLDFIFPPRCPICDGVMAMGENGCHEECRKKLLPVGRNTCCRCGKPVPDETVEYCYDCVGTKRTFERGVSAFVYEDAMKNSMLKFKFFGREEYGAWYAEELMERCETTLRDFGAEAVIPVPIHRKKYRLRGYNQAEVLAAELADRLQLPMYGKYLRRNRFTVPQKELNNRERMRNLRQALEPGRDALMLRKKRMTPNRVILVDDIYTTGSTLEVCSHILADTGIGHIMVATICTGSGY